MRFKTPGRLLVSFSAFAVFFMGILLALDVWQDYERELSVLKENLRMDAKLLAEHAQLSFATAERTLGEIEERFHRGGFESFEQDRDYWERVRRKLSRAPQLAQVAVVDAQGRIRFTSTSFPAPAIDVSDRGYFRAHLGGEALHIDRPLVARDDGKPLIPLTLRINGSAGEFQGVLFASLDLKYFQEFYSGLRDKRDVRVGMFHRDGRVLALYPAAALTAEEQDRVREMVTRAEAGTYIIESPLDGTKKVKAYQVLDTYPLAVATIYDYDLFLAGTVFPLLLRNAIIFLVFAAGVAVSATFIRRATVQAMRARGIQHARERLCGAVIRHLPNGRVASFDRERRYTFAAGQGFSDDPRLASDKIIGKTMDEVYSPEVRPRMEALAAQAFAGNEAEEEISYAGSTYKIMAVPLTDEAGLIDQCMLLTQDITEFKQTQKALEALSATDSLLGIANRREFDRVLEKKWRRSVREKKPLAFLMIDVDQFKLYNDTYGHQAGDECLQQVAQALNEAVNRPEDLVARYGGEEMAVLLQDTDLDGALRVAKRVHETLARRRLPFAESGVADRVTVSIGAASVQASPKLQSAALVEEADSRVYAAKVTGRNTTHPRVESAPHGRREALLQS